MNTYASNLRNKRSAQASARRRRRREAKIVQQERRKLLREINPLLEFAVPAAEKLHPTDRIYPYIRWSSRSPFGRVWRIGRVGYVRRWEIPATTSNGGVIRRFYLTSNHKLIHSFTMNRLYRRDRAAKIASVEELQSIKTGLRQMIETYARQLSRTS